MNIENSARLTVGTFLFEEEAIILKAHLSSQSDLKEKCTQLPTLFLATVFHALSLGVIHFVRSVSLRNHFFVG